MRSRFNTRQRNYIILGLCSILLVMAAGYAAFSSQLNINGTSNITSEFKVLITNIESKNIIGRAENAETPTHTDTTASFSTKLYLPGDSITYDVTVENQGSIDAVLKTINKTNSNNEAIIFTTSGIEQGDILKAHENTKFTVTVTYNSNTTTQPSNIKSDLEITLDYVQAGTDDEGTVLPSETNLMRSYSADSQADYYNDNYKNKIISIEVLNNKNIPFEAVESWDVSERQDGSVMAWIMTDSENSGYYKLYIGGDGGVVANPNSSYLFNKFTQVKTIDLTGLDTKYVTNMRSMFGSNGNLISINFGDNFDTSNVIDMSWMFTDCSSLTELDLKKFDTNHVLNMQSMFKDCNNLINLDLSSFKTSKVTNMSQMFQNCSSLTNLNLSNFDTSNVTNMRQMFADWSYNSKLKTINLSSNFDTSKVTNMYGMFVGLVNLTELNLNSFDTRNVTNMQQMFFYCTSLIDLNLSSFSTGKVTNMSSMFANCSNLSNLILSSFDTSSVTSMRGMFNGCGSLTTLDLSSFNTNKVTDMSNMFLSTTNLQTIYVGSNWITDNSNKSGMFWNCGTDHVTLIQ